MNIACEIPSAWLANAEVLFSLLRDCGVRAVALRTVGRSDGTFDGMAHLSDAFSLLRENNLHAAALVARVENVEDWAFLVRCESLPNCIVLDVGGAAADDSSRTSLVEFLRPWSDRSDNAFSTICLETAPPWCENSREMARTVRAVDQLNVRLNFDTGAYLWLNPDANAEIALQRMLGYIGSVRLRDFGGWTSEPAFPPLGYGGGVDFVLVLQVLKNSGFNGPCLVSFGQWEDSDADLAAFAEGLGKSIGHLRDCGWFDP